MKGAGNSVDYGDRMYDPRLGRWLKVDPLKDIYTSLSPYCFGANNPINILDADGNILKDKNGNIIATANGRVDDQNNKDVYTTKSGSKISLEYKYVTIYTDKGRPVEAKYITKATLSRTNQDGSVTEEDVTNNSQYRSNCHGFTFANGKLWITDDPSIETILQDEYTKVNKSADVAIVTVDPTNTPSTPDESAVYVWHSAKKDPNGDGKTWTDKNGPMAVRTGKDLEAIKNYTPSVKGQEQMGADVDVHLYNKNGPDNINDTDAGTVENGVRFF